MVKMFEITAAEHHHSVNHLLSVHIQPQSGLKPTVEKPNLDTPARIPEATRVFPTPCAGSCNKV